MNADAAGGAEPARWVLAGASGFLGQALLRSLRADGVPVRQLARSEPTEPHQVRWDPAHRRLDPEVLAGAAVVVNLAGVPVQRRWTRANRTAIVASRVHSTGTLAHALAELPAGSPRPVFLAQSATGFYPKNVRPPRRLTEADARPGRGFLGEAVAAWEAATVPAERAGVRVCRLRTGVVLDRSGGALPQLSLPFRLGVGIPLGSGRQHMPLIGLADWLAAVRFAAGQPNLSGPVNLTLPEPVTNRQFTDVLAGLLRRRWLARLPVQVPAPLLRLALDGFASELLDDVDVAPAALAGAGFRFGQPSLAQTLEAALRG